ncbi:cupredoxin family protein [Ferrovibrio sp.]|uniref:cupredoxin domain-containing protein n=1 Tax=Ferrovibrio sp. TaxID=1917215 RepID=UPI0026168ED0|nr:cupredoxin family protein [Ferrovibrio sp.]
MKITTLALAALALTSGLPAAPALAGPGHGGGHSHYDGHAAALGEPGDPKAKARTVNVVMTDEMRFTPGTVTVKRGETIRFIVKNDGQLRHEMTLGTMDELTEHAKVMEQHPDMEHDDPNAVTVEPGETKTILWKFTKAGSFDYGCLVPGHMPAGMKGRITVR